MYSHGKSTKLDHAMAVVVMIALLAGGSIITMFAGEDKGQERHLYAEANFNLDDPELDYEIFYAELIRAEQQFGPYLEMINEHHCDWGRKVCWVHIDEVMLDPTDTGCLQFAYMMRYLTRDDFVIYVTNTGWIPSSRNPIDAAWAARLIGQ